ncbi:hypothetical protein ACU18_02040 [Arthrobacter sp. ZBG10]|uniref:hypothetical protein n=1 Tax=unclassified Arthrobacter TaxID=235627 RepID=UPI0006836380|nr:hypothetical protein [Arthrobacter sp. ZBG10]KNH21702.1 hypothetical protein ACU18_02040 [Arthrobacter sp. ZBG10]
MTSQQRVAISGSLLALGLVLIAWVGSLLWSAIDEGAVPSDSAFHAIPPPSAVEEISTQCGSGGCWREMVVDVEPRQTAQSLAAEMGLTSESCEPLNLWTLRETCTGISSDRGELKIYLRYSSPIS